MPIKNFERFENYIYGIMNVNLDYDPSDKQRAINQMVTMMINRTSAMFRWRGLPDTIPERTLELYLQINGNVCIAEHEEKLYSFCGNLGGIPNANYMPTMCIVANPYLQLNKTYEIDKDCIIIPNDPMYAGLMPINRKYASAIAEAELSLNIGDINSRIISLISAPDDRTKESALKYIDDIKNGKRGVIAENAFLDGIKVQPFANQSANGVLTNIIEEIQYLKASWYNEIGLNANYNMKRESLNSAESQLNNDALMPLIDIMYQYRKTGAKRVNEMFGTSISVELNSAWQDNQIELDMEQNQIGGEPNETE